MKSYERIARHVLDTCDLKKLRQCIRCNDIGVVTWISHNKSDWIKIIESYDEEKIDFRDVPRGESVNQLIFNEIYRLLKMMNE